MGNPDKYIYLFIPHVAVIHDLYSSSRLHVALLRMHTVDRTAAAVKCYPLFLQIKVLPTRTRYQLLCVPLSPRFLHIRVHLSALRGLNGEILALAQNANLPRHKIHPAFESAGPIITSSLSRKRDESPHPSHLHATRRDDFIFYAPPLHPLQDTVAQRTFGTRRCVGSTIHPPQHVVSHFLKNTCCSKHL